MINRSNKIEIDRYFKYALWLGYFTIAFNILEGVISILFRVKMETCHCSEVVS
jgi:hypothetical protein